MIARDVEYRVIVLGMSKLKMIFIRASICARMSPRMTNSAG